MSNQDTQPGQSNQEILSLIFIFCIFLATFFAVKYTWGIYNLPGPSNLVEHSKYYFDKYGLIIFFFTALIESLLLIGNYFPGTLILLFGLSTLIDSPQKVFEAYIYISLGMLLGYIVNYFLGKYGWYKILEKIGYKDELIKIENKLLNNNLSSVTFLYFLPGFGSLLSTSFGVLRFNFLKFISFTFFIVLAWNCAWAIAVYFLGNTVFQFINNGYLVLVAGVFYIFYLYKSGKLQISEELKNSK
jgi:membrane protein DedA with SNARE-associated domain